MIPTIHVNSFVFITPFSMLMRSFLALYDMSGVRCAGAMKFLFKLATGDPPRSGAIGNSIFGDIARAQNGRTHVAMLTSGARCIYDLHEISASVLAITIDGVAYHLGTARVVMIDMCRATATVPIDRVANGAGDYALDLDAQAQPAPATTTTTQQQQLDDDDDDVSWASADILVAPQPSSYAADEATTSTKRARIGRDGDGPSDDDDDFEAAAFDRRERLCMHREVTDEDVRNMCSVNRPDRVNTLVYAQFNKRERNSRSVTTYRGVSGTLVFTGEDGSKQILFLGRDSTIASYNAAASEQFEARVGTIACRRA